MPQMSPSLWLILMLFILMMLNVIMSNYYYLNKTMNYTNMKPDKTLFTWKW